MEKPEEQDSVDTNNGSSSANPVPNFNLYALNAAEWENTEQREIYFHALGKALENDHVYDIAVSGPYGSGKTFLISSYFNQENLKDKTIYISLGTFRPANDNKKSGVEMDAQTPLEEYTIESEKERKGVEQFILQQLIYHVTPDKTPGSRILRISNPSKREMTKTTIWIALFILSIFILFGPGSFSIPEFPCKESVIFVGQVIALAFFLVLSSIAIYRLFGSLRNIKINKVSTAMGDMELDQVNTSSVFYRYLDEILHFFERTEYETVVIEDLDRFNDIEIFTRLRSLNRTINNYPPIRNKKDRRIRFVYAVKDDLFQRDSRDRTKFFDIIIPVVPIISNINSEAKLKSHLEKAGISELPSDDLIWEVSVYINDMRQVKNIVNEYSLYKTILTHTSRKDTLFSAIVYKNLEPVDFSLYFNQKGNLYALDTLKRLLTKFLSKELSERINQKTEQLKSAESELAASENELKRIYIQKALESLPVHANSSNILLSNQNVKISQLIKLQNFDTYFINNRYSHGIGKNSISIHIDDIDKKDGVPGRFQERMKAIETKKNKQEIEKELSDLSAKKNNIEKSHLSELLKLALNGRNNIAPLEDWISNAIECTPEELSILKSFISAPSSLHFLVSRGYIDETIGSLMSYFHADGLQETDRNYLKILFSREGDIPLNELENPDLLLRKLAPEHFENPKILHPSLIKKVVEKSKQYPYQYQMVLEFFKGNRDHWPVLVNLSDTDELALLVHDLAGQFDLFWDYAETANVEVIRMELLKILINHSSKERLTALNTHGSLKKRITELSSLTDIVDKDLQPIKRVIEVLGIQFEQLTDLPQQPQELIDYVYKNNFYAINAQMVEQVTLAKSKRDKSEISNLINSKNFTFIQELGLENLLGYIADHPELYANNVLLALPENTDESESTIVRFINDPKVTEKTKTEVLEKEAVSISTLASVDDPYLTLVLESGKFQKNWGNFIYYYKVKSNGFDDTLKSSITSDDFLTSQEFQNHDGIQDEDRPLFEKLVHDMLAFPKLSGSAFGKLIDFNGPKSDFSYLLDKGLQKEKLRRLVKKKKFLPTDVTLSTLEKIDRDLFLDFLIQLTPNELDNVSANPEWKDQIRKSRLNKDLKDMLINRLFKGMNDN